MFLALFVHIQMFGHFRDLRALCSARRADENLVRSPRGLVAVVPFGVPGKRADAVFGLLDAQRLLADNLAQRGDVLYCHGFLLSVETAIFDNDFDWAFHRKIVRDNFRARKALDCLFAQHNRVRALASLGLLRVLWNHPVHFLRQLALARVHELRDAVFERVTARLPVQIEVGGLIVD